MGGSGWQYTVPYQADVQEALAALQARVFREGRFYCALAQSRSDLGDPERLARTLEFMGPVRFRHAMDMNARTALAPLPRTIEEAVEAGAESGTHSILDMRTASTRPRSYREDGVIVGPNATFGTIAPLPETELKEAFGSAKPTREQISAALDLPQRDRWEGVWIAVYAGGEPTELFIYGSSGD